MTTVADTLRSLAASGDRAGLEEKFLEAVEENPAQLDVFLEVAETVRRMGRKNDAVTLLSMITEHYEASGSAEERRRLFLFLATTNEKERAFRRNLVRALQDCNQENPAFELFLETSGLKGEVRLHDALALLERLRAFEPGRHVYHASGWGVGRIEGVDSLSQELIIHFETGRRHQLPVSSAIQILSSIPDDDWRALRAFQSEELRRLCEEDPGDVVRRILEQVGRALDTTSFKELLAGSVIPAGDWSRWWSAARRAALKRNDVVQEGRSNKLVYRHPESADPLDEIGQVYTAAQALELANAYLRNLSDQERESQERWQRLVSALEAGAGKHAGPADPEPLEVLLLAHDLAEARGLERGSLETKIAALLQDENRALTLLSGVSSLRLARRGLDFYRGIAGEHFPGFLVKLLPRISSQVLDHVAGLCIDSGQSAEMKAVVEAAVKRPESLPEVLVWARRRHSHPRFAGVLGDLDPKNLLQICLSLGEARGKTVDQKLRKLARSVAAEVMANDCAELRALLSSFSESEGRTLRKFISSLRGLTDNNRGELLDACDSVLGSPPGKEVRADADAISYDAGVLYCTPAGIMARQEQYQELVNVKLPYIFDAIGKAASFGDLSENAEYTAALEERAKLTRKAEQMQDEFKRVKPIDETLLVEGRVTVGTQIRVREEETGKEETFILLGPWDADFERGVLDYRAPLAAAFIGHREGDRIATNIGGRARTFQILSIEPRLAP